MWQGSNLFWVSAKKIGTSEMVAQNTAHVGTGFEPLGNSPRKTNFVMGDGAESGARSADSRILADPDLATVVALWPNLAPETKRCLLALVRGSGLGEAAESIKRQAEQPPVE